jgi:hypothetical protein
MYEKMKSASGIQKYLLSFLIFFGLASPGFALEPEPHKWNHLPVGINFAGVGYAYSEADIFLDPTLLLEDVELELHTWAGKYIRTFELFARSARIDLTQAYQEGEWTGLLNGSPASTSRRGLSDTFVRLALNLYGTPPLKGKDFAVYRAENKDETIIGVALAVRLPTGNYKDDKLLNLGKNRFAFRPQLGFIHSWGRWTVEATGEVAFYTKNDDFYNGNTLEQEPLYIIHGHLIYSFNPGFWISASYGYDYGGEISINDVDKDDKKQDIGWVFSLAYPINRSSGIKVSYIETQSREDTGLDSRTLTASIAFLW